MNHKVSFIIFLVLTLAMIVIGVSMCLYPQLAYQEDSLVYTPSYTIADSVSNNQVHFYMNQNLVILGLMLSVTGLISFGAIAIPEIKSLGSYVTWKEKMKIQSEMMDNT